jgi:hypothetical protein
LIAHTFPVLKSSRQSGETCLLSVSSCDN